MFCQYCGKKVNEGVDLCPECNSNLDSLHYPTNYKCDNCGASVPKDAKFCSKCGDKFEEFVESEKSSESDEEISENRETEILIRKRHKTIRELVRFGNFIGWVLIITIIFIPLGLPLLFMGHLVLANLEIEHNTRETATLLRELIEKKNT
ncbi:zinc ribbon domain-containing protein [bacterium]|nr:MAG: zinc ribbon domain-containing protein [bacterium]